MIANGTGVPIEDLAQRLIEVTAQLGLTAPRGRRRVGDLKEIEFLTLSILRQQDTLIVGDIQRQLGVLPAQMSRIIRSLEGRDRPLDRLPHQFARQAQDRRGPDAGRRAAHEEHQAGRIQAVAALLSRLPEEDLDDLQHLLEKVQELIQAQGAV